MSYSTFSSLNTANGLAFYKGYIYASSYDNATINIYKFNDSSTTSTYYSFNSTTYSVGTIKIYGNYLYCILYNKAFPSSQCKIVKFDLTTGTPTPVDLLTGLNVPKSFLIYEYDLFVTLADSILRYNLQSLSSVIIISNTSPSINIPYGIDTDGSYIYFCNSGSTNNNIYRCNFDGSNIITLATMAQAYNYGLSIYGKYIYVCSNFNQIIYKVTISSGTISTFQTLIGTNQKPINLLFVNNQLFISASDANLILYQNVFNGFNTNFSLSYNFTTNIFNYTLNNNFTINGNWQEVGFNTDKVIVDGNNKKITIDTNGLGIDIDVIFFGGGITLTNKLEINNFNVNSSVGLFSTLLRPYGYSKLDNCHIEITGNISNNGGGLCYNNLNKGTYLSGLNLEINNCSSVIIGKIGTNAGSLAGYFAYGCNAIITNSFAILLDQNPETGNKTIGSGAGAFIGSGVGQMGGCSISTSYCIFSGSMAHSSGVIAGKFLGSLSTLTFNKFYAITNITSVTSSSNPSDYSQYSYFISCYTGGSLFTSINASNVNIINFNINNLNMYADSSTVVSSISGINTYTDYWTFFYYAFSETAKVGNKFYFVYYQNYTSPYNISFYPSFGQDNNLSYEALMGYTNKLLIPCTVTMNNINLTVGDPNFTPNITTNSNGIQTLYSQNLNIATIVNNQIHAVSDGTTNITVDVLPNTTYSFGYSLAQLIVSPALITRKLCCPCCYRTKNGRIVVQKCRCCPIKAICKCCKCDCCDKCVCRCTCL